MEKVDDRLCASCLCKNMAQTQDSMCVRMKPRDIAIFGVSCTEFLKIIHREEWDWWYFSAIRHLDLCNFDPVQDNLSD